MKNSKDRKSQDRMKHNREEKMDDSLQEHWFAEDELSPAEDGGASADTLNTKVFNQLFADLGLPSGTLWARDNADASPFFFNFGEEVDYLHLSVTDDCCGDEVVHFEAPSADQVAELLKYTRQEFRDVDHIFWKLTSEINGEEILLPVGIKYYDCEGNHVRRIIATHYWTSTEDENDGHRALALAVGNPEGLDIVSLDINTKTFVRPVVKNQKTS